MKTVTFVSGLAAGMVVTAAAMSAMYPDVPRRMMRDGKRMVRSGKKIACKLFN